MIVSKNLLRILTGLALGATCVNGGEALAVSITATVTDDGTNTTVNGTQLQDGDFLITANAGNPPFTLLGNGVDETIKWDFDFNADPNLSDFRTAIDSGANLTKASIIFNVKPMSGLITTDGTGIPSVKGINIPAIPGVVGSLGQNITFALNLFDYGFNSTHILGAFNSGTLNSIPWAWQDDVIMYSAALTLETDSPPVSVPEPTGILGLLALGTVCMGTMKPAFLSRNR